MVTKEIEDMVTTISFSLKIRNALKLKDKAKIKNLSVSSYLNLLIEDAN